MRRCDAMPQQDVYHNVVKNALIKDGWTITHNPLTLTVGRRDLYVDFGQNSLSLLRKKDAR
jgi:hypothetical protein